MANRNRTQLNIDLFNKLIGKAEEAGVEIAAGGRWIRRLSSEDAELLTTGDSKIMALTRLSRTMVVLKEARRYFLAIGFSSCEAYPAALKRIDATPALFTLAVTEWGLAPSASSAEIRDILQDQFSGIAGYNGHDLLDISGLFPEVFYFEITDGFAASDNISRLTGSFCLRTYGNGPLNFEDDTRDRIASLFESGNDYIPYDVILQGAMAFSWGSFYLELYRCLEQVYSAPRMKALSEEFSLRDSLHDLAMSFERLLSWRPKEDESLLKVIRYCTKSSIDSALSSFNCDECEDFNTATDAASRAIYKLRNALVHFRPSAERINLDDKSWNAIVVAMSDLVAEVYDAIGEMFHKPRVKDIQPAAA